MAEVYRKLEIREAIAGTNRAVRLANMLGIQQKRTPLTESLSLPTRQIGYLTRIAGPLLLCASTIDVRSTAPAPCVPQLGSLAVGLIQAILPLVNCALIGNVTRLRICRVSEPRQTSCGSLLIIFSMKCVYCLRSNGRRTEVPCAELKSIAFASSTAFRPSSPGQVKVPFPCTAKAKSS